MSNLALVHNFYSQMPDSLTASQKLKLWQQHVTLGKASRSYLNEYAVGAQLYNWDDTPALGQTCDSATHAWAQATKRAYLHHRDVGQIMPYRPNQELEGWLGAGPDNFWGQLEDDARITAWCSARGKTEAQEPFPPSALVHNSWLALATPHADGRPGGYAQLQSFDRLRASPQHGATYFNDTAGDPDIIVYRGDIEPVIGAGLYCWKLLPGVWIVSATNQPGCTLVAGDQNDFMQLPATLVSPLEFDVAEAVGSFDMVLELLLADENLNGIVEATTGTAYRLDHEVVTERHQLWAALQLELPVSQRVPFGWRCTDLVSDDRQRNERYLNYVIDHSDDAAQLAWARHNAGLTHGVRLPFTPAEGRQDA